MRWISIVAATICLILPPAFAQGLGYTPRTDGKEISSYELVSIHPTKGDPATDGAIQEDPNGLTATGVTLKALVAEAYGFFAG